MGRSSCRQRMGSPPLVVNELTERGASRDNASKGQTSLSTGIAAALVNNNKATVQVMTSDADCFGVTTADVRKADGLLFNALGASPVRH